MDKTVINYREQHNYRIISDVIERINADFNNRQTLKNIASEMNLNEYCLQRILSTWANLSPNHFLQLLTKEHALEGLKKSGDLSTVSSFSNIDRQNGLIVSYEAMTPEEIKSGGHGLTVGFGIESTPFGEALFGWTARGLCYLEFFDDNYEGKKQELITYWPNATLARDDQRAAELSSMIFTVSLQRERLNLVLRGTDFQLKVWGALLNTNPSQLISYSQLAVMIGSAKAQRAVGSALAANTIGYLIPCHRVIKGSGEAGHYRWGRRRKLAMQTWEAGRMLKAENSCS